MSNVLRLTGWSGRGVLLAAGLAIVLGGLGQWATAAVAEGQPLLDTRFGWSRADAATLLSHLGAFGRAGYTRLLVLDTASGVAFGVATAAAFAWLSRRGGPPRTLRAAAALGLAVAVLDVVENSLIAVLLGAWPDHPTAVGTVASAVTSAKLLAVPVLLAGLAAGMLGPGVRALRRRRAADRTSAR